MAVIRCGLPDLLLRFGTAIHDLTLTESAEGSRVSRSWAARELNGAQREIFGRLMRSRMDAERMGSHEFDLTVDANDSSRYILPVRCRKILWIKDGTGAYFDSLDAIHIGNSGFVVSGRFIEFLNATPTGTVTIRCVLEPTEMSYGASAATSGATSLLLASSPTVGNNVLMPTYYAGARIGFETGTAAGYTADVTAFTVATRACTVATMSPAPSASGEYYSILMDLPDCMGDAVVLRAAYNVCKADEGLATKAGPKGMQMLREQYEEAYVTGRAEMQTMMMAHVEMPRRGVWDPFNMIRE